MRTVFPAVRDQIRRGAQAALCTIIASSGSTPRGPGARMAVFTDGGCIGTIGGGAVERLAQEYALTVLEEGPPRAVFLFCASNSAVLLPTVRSRCVEWNLGDEDAAVCAGDSRAEALCALLDRRDALGLAAFFTALETGKTSREELQSLLEHTWELVGQSLLAASGCGGRNLCPHLSRRQLSAAADVLRDAAAQLRFNLGVGHMAGALAVLLHERTGR